MVPLIGWLALGCTHPVDVEVAGRVRDVQWVDGSWVALVEGPQPDLLDHLSLQDTRSTVERTVVVGTGARVDRLTQDGGTLSARMCTGATRYPSLGAPADCTFFEGADLIRLDDEGTREWVARWRVDGGSTLTLTALAETEAGFVAVGTLHGAAEHRELRVQGRGGDDVLVWFVDAGGRSLAVHRMGGAAWDRATHVAALPGGDVLVGGTFERLAAFGAVVLESAAGEDAFVARVGVDGVRWAERWGGPDDDEVGRLTHEGGGRALVHAPLPDGTHRERRCQELQYDGTGTPQVLAEHTLRERGDPATHPCGLWVERVTAGRRTLSVQQREASARIWEAP